MFSRDNLSAFLEEPTPPPALSVPEHLWVETVAPAVPEDRSLSLEKVSQIVWSTCVLVVLATTLAVACSG